MDLYIALAATLLRSPGDRPRCPEMPDPREASGTVRQLALALLLIALFFVGLTVAGEMLAPTDRIVAAAHGPAAPPA